MWIVFSEKNHMSKRIRREYLRTPTKEEIINTKKPDYRDYNISEDIYQKKYVNKEGYSFPPILTHLISLILIYSIYYNFTESIDNFLEFLWTEFGGSMGFEWFTGSIIFVAIIFYKMFYDFLKIIF